MPTCTPMTEKVQKKVAWVLWEEWGSGSSFGCYKACRLPDPVKIRRFILRCVRSQACGINTLTFRLAVFLRHRHR